MSSIRWFVLLSLVIAAVAGPAYADKSLSNGMKCTFDSDCESKNCSFKVCKSRSGGKQLGNGAACTFDSDCESKNCSFKVCKKR